VYSIAPVLKGRPKVFRDPVHGDIAYERGAFQDLIRSVIDTEAFQRLRSIRQNGVLNLVFHGAEHSRFTHSMGVAWVARQMFDAVTRNSSIESTNAERESVILAALLHDVGHGPFSHLLEEILGKKTFHHEHLTVRLISDPESPICSVLKNYRADLPSAIVPFIDKHKRTEQLWYYELVSSQLDADRLDYLARDGYMAGVQSHQFDSRRLISFLGVEDKRLVVDVRARDVLENYLLALDQMYQSVYYHHTVRAASSLVSWTIRRALDVAKESNRPEQLFPTVGKRRDPLWALASDGEGMPIAEYVALDEPHVWGLFRQWRASDDKVLADLCRRFTSRCFPKAIDFRPDLDFRATQALFQDACAIWKRKHPEFPVQYYVEIDEPDRVGYKRYKSGEGPGQSIMVTGPEGRPRPIEELSRSIVQVIENKFVARRLIVPAEIADEARQLIKEKT
jgi:HD superfamily phosphohydrolase